EDRRGDARGAACDFVHGDGEPGAPNLLEHSAKGRPGHRGLRSEGLEPRRPEIFLTSGGLEIREQELADGRAVERSPLADKGPVADWTLALHLVDVDGGGGGGGHGRQGRGLPALGGEILEERPS